MWLIMQKELLELVRDRKTLFFMIALPLLIFPAIFGVVGYFTSQALSEAESKVLKYAITGGAAENQLTNAMLKDDGFELVSIDTTTDFKPLIRSKQLDFVIQMDANVDLPLLQGGQNKVILYLNDASLNMVEKRLKKHISVLSAAKQHKAFTVLALSAQQQSALLKPIVIHKVDLSEERESWGEKLGGLVPYVLFLLCLQGAMFPASDMAAGEKERGTLETLLLVPLSRQQIVLGKFFTVALAGIVAALVTVFSMALWGIIIGQGMAITFIQDFMGKIGAVEYLLMFLMLIPVAAIFAALLLSLSIYARSYKEAQSYMGSLVFLVILPIVISTLPGVDLTSVWAWVPLTNVALAIKELIKGTMDYLALLAIFMSTAAIAGGLLAFCVYWFKQEKVLFR